MARTAIRTEPSGGGSPGSHDSDVLVDRDGKNSLVGYVVRDADMPFEPVRRDGQMMGKLYSSLPRTPVDPIFPKHPARDTYSDILLHTASR